MDGAETVKALEAVRRTMCDWLAARVRASPDATALIDADSDDRVTYTRLDERTERIAAGLGAKGVRAGDHVGCVLGVGPAAVSLVHAAARIGAVLVPLSGRLTGTEIETRLRQADCSLLVYGSGTEAAASAVGGIERAGIVEIERAGSRENGEPERATATETDSGPGPDNAGPDNAGPDNAGPDNAGLDGSERSFSFDDPLIVLFTSGTTGRPKGVVLTAGNVFASAGASATRLGTLPGDRWLSVLSIGGMGGLAPIYRSVLYGTALVTQESFDARRTTETLSAYGCTGVSLVPTMLDRMLDAVEEDEAGGDRKGMADSLRFVLLGGAPASRELIERCREHSVPVYPTYGMTETTSQVATARPAEAFRHPGTVGRPLVGVDVEVVENGVATESGERGELVVSGPIVTTGYYGDPGTTGETFSEHGFHTGDLGYIDEAGRVWVTGRLDDRIVTGGETVDPAEVRETLRAHPAVCDAAVVGIESAEWGERVSALVVAREALSRDELDAHCRERLAGYKLPRVLAFAEELPRTESGTVDRGELRERLGETDES